MFLAELVRPQASVGFKEWKRLINTGPRRPLRGKQTLAFRRKIETENLHHVSVFSSLWKIKVFKFWPTSRHLNTSHPKAECNTGGCVSIFVTKGR